MDVVAKLTADLRYGSLPDRRAALLALAERGPAAAPALPDLIAALRDADDAIRDRATTALQAIGPDAVPALLAALLPEDVPARRAVVRMLGHMGPDASVAMPVLTAALQDQQLAEDAAWALGEIQGRPLQDLRQRLTQAAPLLAVLAVVVLMVTLSAWLSTTEATAPLEPHLGGRIAAALAVLGAGLGCLLGGSHWGRPGALTGFVVIGLAGYVLGLLAGGMVEELLGPLGDALRRK